MIAFDMFVATSYAGVIALLVMLLATSGCGTATTDSINVGQHKGLRRANGELSPLGGNLGWLDPSVGVLQLR